MNNDGFLDEDEIRHELKDVFGSTVDLSYIPIYLNSWSTYEECGNLCILWKDGKYFTLEWGYCVMVDNNDAVWEPVQVLTDDEVMELITEFEECVNEINGP